MGAGSRQWRRTLERLAGRLPPGRADWPRRRVLAAAAVVVLVVVVAVSCGGGAGGRADVPGRGGRARRRGDRRPGPVRRGPAARCGWSPAEIDSLDPQRSYLPGVWNLMRLYTRTLVTYSLRAGRAPTTRSPTSPPTSGTPSEDGLSWTFTLRDGRALRERPARSPRRDVKYGIERSFASDVIVGGPTYVVDLLDDPGNPYAGPYQDEAPDKLGLAAVETPDDRTIIFRLRAPQPDFPFVMALPSQQPGAGGGRHRRRVRPRPGLLRAVR